MDAPRLLAGLDADQRRAVVSPAQPLRILAGAGSGKTRVLTRRIAHRVVEGSADPRHVLALTFTRKAATEMGSRLGRLGLRDRPTVGTFHAVAWAQLRIQAGDARRPLPSLLRQKGRLLAQLPGRNGIATGDLAAEIEWSRARDLSADDYPLAARQHDRRVAAPYEQIASLIAAYEQAKARRGVMDFDDMLALCADLLEDDPRFGAAQRYRFRHLFVDEFQDVNPLQHRLLRGWLGDRADLCVVGDPNQAIYRWNGADASYLVRFDEHHPGGATVELTRSYRSTPQILHLAQAALAGGRRARLVAVRPAGDLPRMRGCADEEAEARAVAAEARLQHAPGRRWDDQAVLVRTNGQMAAFETAFARARIPFRIHGDQPLAWRDDIRAALRHVAPGDGHSLARAKGDLVDLAIEARFDVGERDDRTLALDSLVRLSRELLAMEATATIGDLRAWLATAMGLDGPGPDGDAVQLATFHAAKGLEWPVVHLAGLERGLVPIAHARTPEAEAEERRLLYVAITRARDVLRLTWAGEREVLGQPIERRPSPYLHDLEPALADLLALSHIDPSEGLARARRELSEPERRPDQALLGALREWRAEVARGADVPPTVVLSDRVVAEVARRRPHDDAALGAVRGVGASTLAAYGADLLRIVAAHDRAPTRP